MIELIMNVAKVKQTNKHDQRIGLVNIHACPINHLAQRLRFSVSLSRSPFSLSPSFLPRSHFRNGIRLVADKLLHSNYFVWER